MAQNTIESKFFWLPGISEDLGVGFLRECHTFSCLVFWTSKLTLTQTLARLTLNLGHECGLEQWLEPAFLMKHGDNMRKQHESVTHLSWARTAHAEACDSSEESTKHTVSRTASGKWLLHSKEKLIKPYDYVPSDYSMLLTQTQQGRQDNGSEKVEKISQPHHSSGHDSSQYTFAHVGIQTVVSENLPKGATDLTGHHGWQPALMTSMTWMASVAGEYLTKMGRKPKIAPVQLPRLIDDPVSTLEQTVVDLRVAQEAKDVSGILKQFGLLMCYTMLMATTMHLHPYLSSTFLWIRAWQLSKTLDKPKVHMKCCRMPGSHATAARLGL